ncbi:MAG: hypothetical protein M3S32_04995 [Acidobacteriota bacterium]|nr:hypothetical protein [Acidobacteriota bacterium]
MNIAGGRTAQTVGFRANEIRRMEMGTGLGGSRVRCTVALSGTVDETWRRCFRAVQLEDTGFFRFRLEMGSNTITFLVSESRRGEMASELKTLSYLLDAANLLARTSP